MVTSRMTSRASAIGLLALAANFAPAASFTIRAPALRRRGLFADPGEVSSSPPTEDWRDFRARLVAQESGETNKPAGGEQTWAYETNLVEVI